MSTINTATKPQKISNDHCFGVTPFGVYCLECCIPIGNWNDKSLDKALRMHILRRKHSIPDETTSTSLAQSLQHEITNRFANNKRDYSAWFTKTNIQSFRCTCGLSFSKSSNVTRHIKNAERNNPKGKHKAVCKQSVLTVCGRILDKDLIAQMSNVPEFSDVMNEYVPLETKNNKWISMTSNNVKKIFSPYKRADENLEPYLPSLKLLAIYEDGPVIGRIKECLAFVDDDRSKNDDTLNFFLDCNEKWIKNYCREHVNVLDGKSRFKLSSYFDETILVNAGYNQNFNMREREDVILKETLLIVAISWKLHEKGLCNENLSHTLSKLKEDVSKMEKYYDGAVNDSTMQHMIKKMLIQYYLHCIMIEEKVNAYFLLMAHHIAMLRLFKMKKETSTGGESNLSMRSCGEFGSLLGLHIHIYRLASASLMACSQSICWEKIVNNVNDSAVCHTLSPIINKVKNMSNEKLVVRKKEMKPNGDIIIDDFHFPKCQWSRIIPKLKESFESLMEKFFCDDDWKLLVDMDNEIFVQRIELNLSESLSNADVLHYNFYTNVEGKIIMEKDLTFRKEIDKQIIEHLTGIVMITLHGTGLGATRVSEIFRIKLHQMCWKGGSFYYKTTSNKRRSSKAGSKKSVDHKLPRCLSRYLVLYDWIGREFSKGRDEFIFSSDDRNEMTVSNYNNQYFYTEFSSIFEIQSEIPCLVMRHLYTSICNHLFPSSTDHLEGNMVSAIEDIAEMSGHTTETHDRYYSSSICKESQFDKYHCALGAHILLDSTENTQPLKIATESDCLHYLKLLFGAKSNFFSKNQSRMVMNACNNIIKHTFCSIGCGGGKSLSWIIPALRMRKEEMHHAKMCIVVIPYCFLLDHHVNSTNRILGQCSRVNVKSLKGKEIYDNVLPNIIRHKNSLPSILFLSLEAVEKLIEKHFYYLEGLQRENHISKIYIDECHTILSELRFRSSYRCLSKLAKLGTPMVLFSGSFQKFFIKDFMSYMFGSDDCNAYDFIVDDQIFGQELMTMKHISSDNYMVECCNDVQQFMKDHVGRSIHIIVATKDEGE